MVTSLLLVQCTVVHRDDGCGLPWIDYLGPVRDLRLALLNTVNDGSLTTEQYTYTHTHTHT